jgi:hypothetical protein
MKRLALSVALSSFVAFALVSTTDLGDGTVLRVERAEAQPAKTKRAPRTKRGTKQPTGGTTPAQVVVACGARGQPMCPLERWMEDNAQAAAENGDLPRLAEVYTKMAGWAPSPAWNTGPTSWRAISEAAATKARAGDLRGARSACKSCHQAWREKYRTEFRGRAVPN